MKLPDWADKARAALGFIVDVLSLVWLIISMRG